MDKKKGKYCKLIITFESNIILIINHMNNMNELKLLDNETYNEKITILSNIIDNVENIKTLSNKKRVIKPTLENLINETNTLIEQIIYTIGLNTCTNIINILFSENNICETFVLNQSQEFKDIFHLYDNYFYPTSCQITAFEKEKLQKNYNLLNFNIPNVVQSDIHRNVIEKIEGATIIIYIPNANKVLHIHGHFKKDVLNILKFSNVFKQKYNQIKEHVEILDMLTDFKENYIEQLSLKNFVILNCNEIISLLKSDYKELLDIKNKALSAIIKDFTKASLEKQIKMITLLLIAGEETQYIAHIIFDLITSQLFLAENNSQLSDIIYNSLHWNIQKLFKVTNTNFVNSKKKIQSLTVNDVPYESRILTLNTNENIKAKALEKVKEVNGSKENSAKAQQWLDGFLKIPFGIYKKESIFEFSKLFQDKIDKYINIFTIKISEIDVTILYDDNKTIYNYMNQIIDEYHTIIFKSDNSYNNFVSFLETSSNNIKHQLLNTNDNDKIIGQNTYTTNYSCSTIEEEETEDESISNTQINTQIDTDLSFIQLSSTESLSCDELIKMVQNDINREQQMKTHETNTTIETPSFNESELYNRINIKYKKIIESYIENKLAPSHNVINECLKELTEFKKVKNDLIKKNTLTDANYEFLLNKLIGIESLININYMKEESFEELCDDKIKYNNLFVIFIIKNINDINNFVSEWNESKEKRKKYMNDVDKIMDTYVYGHVDAKKQMKRIIGQWINGISKGQCFGFYGPPGVGKTTLCKNGLAKCLFDENGDSRPFAFLPLGGASNGSFLEGHNYTYLGSTWGKILDILMETKCMNPIIYVDELDKISKTEHGREIVSLLTHITDQSQNTEFFDKYFGSIPIDLSQILFIFSYNDRDSIDRILRDRIQEIKISSLSLTDKLIVSKNYLCPTIYNNIGYAKDEIIMTNEALLLIIENYTYEAGVRKLNEILSDIIRDINLKKIMSNDNNYPIYITKEYVKNFMEDKSKLSTVMINEKSRIGVVNGLFASTVGLGGITIIQIMKTYSEKKLAVEKITGSLGDVMKDSVNVALTICWNILPTKIKERMKDECIGLHIHCPDLSTSKDGPSASLAFCLGFISRICEIPVKNTVALTGEMDLLGTAMEIGGLETKLMGAINAGVKTVLIPKDNENTLQIILKNDEDEKEYLLHKFKNENEDVNNLLKIKSEYINENTVMFRNKLTVHIVNNIFDVLHYALEENDLIFNTNI